MKKQNRLPLTFAAGIAILIYATTTVGAVPDGDRAAALDKAFSTLAKFDWGGDAKLLAPIDEAVVATHGDAAARKALELRLAAVLSTKASRAAKNYVCRALRVIGTTASVPALAALLPDKELSHMARFALQSIPGPESAQALRDALPKLQGALKIGVIQSLGARQDAASVDALEPLLTDADQSVAIAAARATGNIGSPEAATVLASLTKKAPSENKPAVADAILACADRLCAGGKVDEASAALLVLIAPSGQSRQLRLATARCGLAIARDTREGMLPKVLTILLHDRDKNIRAVGLDYVRTGIPGAEATALLSALLPELPREAQADLLAALATRGDRAARPAVLEITKNKEEPVRAAALRALGSLGEAEDIPLLVKSLASPSAAEKAAARDSLVYLVYKGVSEAIAAESAKSKGNQRVELIDILAERRAFEALPVMFSAAEDADAAVRKAAVAALAQLAGPEQIPGMIHAFFKAEKGSERETVEKAISTVCSRTADTAKRAEPVVAAMAVLSETEKGELLPTLGRVGGPAALTAIGAAIAAADPGRREAGVRALCNWPDASVADRLLELVQKAPEAEYRLWALRALVRVAALPDNRSDAQRLDLLKVALSLATQDPERRLVVVRCRAVRSIQSLRFVLPYLKEPAFADDACATVVELAHHRELREPNKPEFDKALDAVIGTSKDAKLIDDAKRYKKGQT